MLKGKKIRENDDWKDFVTEHPEIKVSYDLFGNVIAVIFPKESEHKTLIVLCGKVAYLQYTLNEQIVTYSEPLISPEKTLHSCYRRYNYH